jgi:hypothetical protein
MLKAILARLALPPVLALFAWRFFDAWGRPPAHLPQALPVTHGATMHRSSSKIS